MLRQASGERDLKQRNGKDSIRDRRNIIWSKRSERCQPSIQVMSCDPSVREVVSCHDDEEEMKMIMKMIMKLLWEN